MHYLEAHEMPPENKPQPTPAERELIARWIEAEVLGCDCEHPDPGRVTLRRLNRAEYNNTIRDLVGVDFRPADDVPADDVGYGFDNIGDVLSVSPLLLEKYFAAAQKILDAAIVLDTSPTGPVKRFEAEAMESTAQGGPYGKGFRALNREGEVYTAWDCKREGDYIVRARAFGQQAGPDPARMEFRVDDEPVKVFEVKAEESRPKVYEFHTQFTPGTKKLAAAYINTIEIPTTRTRTTAIAI
jgi:hypothetical protein